MIAYDYKKRIPIIFILMAKKRLLLISDFYWPVKGGMEQAEYGLASLLGSEYALTIATHSREPHSSLPGRDSASAQFRSV